MHQLDLLGTTEHIRRDGLEIDLVQDFLAPGEASRVLQQLIETTPWEQPRVRVYGKWHLTPRLVSFHAEPDLAYAYSEWLHAARPWTPMLLDLRQRLAAAANSPFNAVLLNYYRDGRDSIGWHADDETELGADPVIASLSVGAARELFFKPRGGQGERLSLRLASGSLMIMRGKTQQNWLHHLPRRARCSRPRVNLTFRLIRPLP